MVDAKRKRCHEASPQNRPRVPTHFSKEPLKHHPDHIDYKVAGVVVGEFPRAEEARGGK